MERDTIPTGGDVPDAATDGGNVERSTDRPPAPERESSEESLVELAQQPVVVSWVKFVGAVAASIGIGIGVLVLLIANVFEATLWEFSGFGRLSLSLPPDQVPYLAVFLGAILGTYLGRMLTTDDRTTYLVAGLSGAAGVVAMLLTSAVLTSLVVSDLSLRFGDLVLIAIASAVVVGAVGAGGVWISRTLYPEL